MTTTRPTYKPAQTRILGWLRDHRNIHFTTRDVADDLGCPQTTVSSALNRWSRNRALDGLSSPAHGIWMYRPSVNGTVPMEQARAEILASPEPAAEDLPTAPAPRVRRSRTLQRDDLLKVLGTAGGKVLVADEHDRIYVLHELEA